MYAVNHIFLEELNMTSSLTVIYRGADIAELAV